MRNIVGIVGFALLAIGCGGGDGAVVTATPGSVPAGSSAAESLPATVAQQLCADVVAVDVSGGGPFTFSVTVSSPDTGWDKYADEWRIESESGEVLAVRELTHPHVDEQPFTRSLGGVEIAPGSSVTVAARDSVEGYCGAEIAVTVGT
jgi:hypothetical protein